MSNLFLDSYSVSGCLTFNGFFKHREAFLKETSWNGYAVIHLALTALHLIPGISQVCYVFEGVSSTFFVKAAQPAPKPLQPEQIKLVKGTFFGTMNQYTGITTESERQSCSVQAFTFLSALLQKGSIYSDTIDACIKEGHETFSTLSQTLQEKRKSDARDYLISQRIRKEDVDAFLRENPTPSLKALLPFARAYRLNSTHQQIFLQFFSSDALALTAEEAFEPFKSSLSLHQSCPDLLVENEADRKENFKILLACFPKENSAGALITCNGITVASGILRTENFCSFFIYDSHGTSSQNDGNPAAFIKVFETEEEVADYLASTFGYCEGGTNQVEAFIVMKG